jgi:hypothetical protein
MLRSAFSYCPKEALMQARRMSEWIAREPNHPALRALHLPSSPIFVHIAVTGEDFGEMALRPELFWSDLPPNTVVMSATDLEATVDFLRSFGYDGRDFVRLMLERAELHERLRVEDQIDYANAFVRERGSLRRVLRGKAEGFIGGGLDRYSALYRYWFTLDPSELNDFDWGPWPRHFGPGAA